MPGGLGGRPHGAAAGALVLGLLLVRARGQDAHGTARVSVADLTQRMLKIYASPLDAFQSLDTTLAHPEAALDARPVKLQQFVQGVKTFDPPLTEEQAKAAFGNLDYDQDGELTRDEFLSAIKLGKFRRDAHNATTKPAAMGKAGGEKGGGTEQDQGHQPTSISAAELRARVLEEYNTLRDAFAEMDASAKDLDAALDEKPLKLQDFLRSVSNFDKPLTKAQAENVFVGLDKNQDKLLQEKEFIGGLQAGEYATTATETSTTTATWTSTSTTTFTTTASFAPGAAQGAVSVTDLEASMMNKYGSPRAAFDALNVNPSDVHTFVRLAASLTPPLTAEQARFAFGGLDADGDQLLTSTEFLEVLRLGHLFPTADEFKEMFLAPGSKEHQKEGGPRAWRCPWQLGAALLLLVGYVMRTLFLAARLPGCCGVMAAGVALAHILPEEMRQTGDSLQQLVFFITIVCAGFQAGTADSERYAWSLALIPSAMECGCVALHASWLGFSPREAMVLGCVLFSSCEGAVLPKVHALARELPGSGRLLGLVRMTSPLEAFLAVAVFGCLGSCTAPATSSVLGLFQGAAALSALRLGASVAVGLALGFATAAATQLRTRLRILGRQCFSGAGSEAATLMGAGWLAGASLGCLRLGWLRQSLSQEAAFQPELLLLSSVWASVRTCGPRQLVQVEDALGGVWLVSQLFLFGLLGSTAGTSFLARLEEVIPLIITSLSARFVGTFIALLLTTGSRQCPCERCARANSTSLVADSCFVFLASLPRASVQAALGPELISGRVLPGLSHHGAKSLIAAAARIYVLVLSTAGALLLDALGPALLRWSARSAPACGSALLQQKQLDETGWTCRHKAQAVDRSKVLGSTLKLGLISDDDVLFQDVDAPAFLAKDAAQTLARLYDVDPAVIRAVLEPVSTHTPTATHASYTALEAEAAEDASAAWGQTAPNAQVRGKAAIRSVARLTTLPSAAQFEADGLAMAENSATKSHSKAVRL